MRYTLLNCTLLDGTKNMKPRPHTTIWIQNEIILRITSEREIMPESTVIDCEEDYVIPGLINMHVHLAAAGKPPKANAKPVDYKGLAQKLLKSRLVKHFYRKLEEDYAKQELYSGVTTLRAVGGLLDFDSQVRDRIRKGEIPGPRILAANTAISVPGGHFAGSLATETTNSSEAVLDVQRIAATKPDLIKLMITGGVMDASEEGEPGALRMSPEIVHAACEEAHRLGYRVAAHVESSEGVRVALENGVDTIEHGAQPTEEILRLFKERKAADICTLSPALPYALFDESVSHCGEIGRKNGRIVFEGIIAMAKACLAEGIPVGMGTDTGCPFITHYNMWREIHYFQKYLDVTPEFALYTATLGNAKIAEIDQRTGSIAVGKDADLLILEKNPLENFAYLKDLEFVFAKGRMVQAPKVKPMPGVDEALDAYM